MFLCRVHVGGCVCARSRRRRCSQTVCQICQRNERLFPEYLQVTTKIFIKETQSRQPASVCMHTYESKSQTVKKTQL